MIRYLEAAVTIVGLAVVFVFADALPTWATGGSCDRTGVAEHPDARGCTGLMASWCPVHGNCVCRPVEGVRQEGPGDDDDCPLHRPSPMSP